MCYPWPQIPDPLVKGKHRLIPPSGMAAGIYARTDESRGVWKAPAGQSAVIKASVLAHDVTAAEQELLNPTGINCLRRLGANILIYGARTLSGSTDASIYVPVERLRLFLSESLRNGLHWVVFEPNDEPLWSRIRLICAALRPRLPPRKSCNRNPWPLIFCSGVRHGIRLLQKLVTVMWIGWWNPAPATGIPI